MAKNNEEFEEIEMIKMEFDDGTSADCEIIAIFEVQGKDYIALDPVETSDGLEETDILLYQYKELADEEVELLPITDDEEFEIVADAFDEILDEMEFNSMPD